MIQYKKYLVNKRQKVLLALNILDKLIHKVLIIIDDKGRLAGTITDGDIRRSIIRKENELYCESIMNSNCIYANNENLEEMIKKAKKKGVSLIPIVDENKYVIGAWEVEFFLTEKKKNTAVIMAGGKGTRLLPLTKNIPKPMVEVGGKPIIERIINKLILEGFHNIVISLGHLPEVIEEYIIKSKFDASIVFSRENAPLGTAGALFEISKKDINYPILVTNGDILCDCNLSRIIEKAQVNNFDGIMLGKEQKINVPFGVIDHENGRWKGITEKPMYSYIINAGIYVLSEAMVKLINGKVSLDMTSLFEMAQENNLKLGVEYTSQYWIDIGRYESLESANKHFER